MSPDPNNLMFQTSIILLFREILICEISFRYVFQWFVSTMQGEVFGQQWFGITCTTDRIQRSQAPQNEKGRSLMNHENYDYTLKCELDICYLSSILCNFELFITCIIWQ